MALIDLHCHLDLYADPFAVAAEAIKRGVYVLSVTTTPSAFNGTKKLAPANGRIQTALGLHPELAVQRERELGIFEKLLPLTNYVGEVGLDGSRDHRDSLEHQRAILVSILEMCSAAGGRTISMHSRGASKVLLDTIETHSSAGTFVLHWFSAPERDVRRASERGCWFSVGATMLNSEAGRRSVRAMPVERILPETDGPFTSDGDRPLFPWEACNVAAALASILERSEVEVNSIFRSNLKQLVAAVV
ncbi:MAG: Qat anti-phage system TatD family nuclease QatD [Parvularculaceae bacterium]